MTENLTLEQAHGHSSFHREEVLRSGDFVEGQIEIIDSLLTFTPADDLESETEYEAMVEGVRDLSGQAMVGTYGWTFITRDSVAPQVSQTLPTNGETSAPLLVTIVVRMTECLAPEQANAELEVVGPDGQPICCWEM